MYFCVIEIIIVLFNKTHRKESNIMRKGTLSLLKQTQLKAILEEHRLFSLEFLLI